MSQLLASRAQSEKNEPSAELLEKFQAVSDELREETGGVVLFGLFEPDEAPGQWDLLVAADWISPEVADAVAYVAGKIQQRLTPDELMLLAGVVPLRSFDPFVRQLLEAFRVQALGLFENCTFNGIHIARAWIFTADPSSHSDFQPPPYVTQPQARVKAKSKPVQRKR
jgi:hypothetical protein